MNKEEKIFVLFETNMVSVYRYLDKLEMVKKEQIFFNETLVNNEMFNKIDNYINNLENIIGEVNNKKVRLYATGVFQDFSEEEQKQLVIHVYVTSGLNSHTIKPDLEKFYLEMSTKFNGTNNIIERLIRQEFRTVVICGSFQKHMSQISELMGKLNEYNIEILSPWTKEVVPETLGTDFILLKGQELYNERDSWRHKFDHMNKFVKADAIIICNPNGTVGKGTMFEFGFMTAYSKRIIFTEEPKDLSIMFPYEIGLNF